MPTKPFSITSAWAPGPFSNVTPARRINTNTSYTICLFGFTRVCGYFRVFTQHADIYIYNLLYTGLTAPTNWGYGWDPIYPEFSAQHYVRKLHFQLYVLKHQWHTSSHVQNNPVISGSFVPGSDADYDLEMRSRSHASIWKIMRGYCSLQCQVWKYWLSFSSFFFSF